MSFHISVLKVCEVHVRGTSTHDQHQVVAAVTIS